MISGSHYVRGKRGIAMIAEVFRHLQLSFFLGQAELDRYKTLFDVIT